MTASDDGQGRGQGHGRGSRATSAEAATTHVTTYGGDQVGRDKNVYHVHSAADLQRIRTGTNSATRSPEQAPDTLRAFAPPPGFADLVSMLRTGPWAALRAPSGSGRRTAAIAALVESGSQVLYDVPSAWLSTADAARLAETSSAADIEANSGLIVDLRPSQGTPSPSPAQVQMTAIADRLTSRSCWLVVILDESARWDDPRLDLRTVDLGGRPSAAAVVAAHVRDRLGPLRSSDAEELLSAPDVAAELAAIPPWSACADLAYLGETLAARVDEAPSEYGTPPFGWIGDRARELARGRIAERLASLPDTRAWHLAIGEALVHGEEPAVATALAHILDQATHQAGHRVGTHLVGPDVACHPAASGHHADLDLPGYAEELIRQACRDGLHRRILLNALAIAGLHQDPGVRSRASIAVGRLGGDPALLPWIRSVVLDRWIRAHGDDGIRSAVAALREIQRQPRSEPSVSTIVEEWLTSDSSRPQIAGATACRDLVAVWGVAATLDRLTRLAGDRDPAVRSAVADAVAGLALATTDHAAVAAILEVVDGWHTHGDPRRRRTARLALLVFLGPSDRPEHRPYGPAAQRLALRTPEFAEPLGRLWSAALRSAEFGVAARSTLRGWQVAAGDDADLASGLTAVLAVAAADHAETREILARPASPPPDGVVDAALARTVRGTQQRKGQR